MTSRERVLNAINHKESDRIPIDLGATLSSGISAIGYNKLKNSLGITDGHNRVFEVVQQVSRVEQSVIDKIGIDAIDIGRSFDTENSDWKDVTLSDGSSAQWPSWFNYTKENDGSYSYYNEDNLKLARMPKGATFFDQTFFPYQDDFPDNYKGLSNAMDHVLWQKLPRAPWTHAKDPDFWQQLREHTIKLRQTTDKALIIVAGCNLFEWGTYLRRMDNFLMDIYSEPDEVEKLLDSLLEIHMNTLENICNAIGDVADICLFGDDLGMDSNMFMAKNIFQELFKPRQAMMCNYVHTHSNMKTFLHSCGSIHDILDDLIDAGFDVLNPIQTTAHFMEPERLKKEFGKDITFWGGGCNTRSVLNRGTPQEVYDYTRRVIDIWAPGGGFVFNQEHNILPDVPGENMLAMYKAVHDFKY